MREHPAAHLIVGVLPEDGVVGDKVDYSGAKQRRDLLARLAAALSLSHKYALTVNRERDGTHIHVALADATDAAKLSRAVGARGSGRYPGFASQRSFFFDEKAARAITKTLELSGPRASRKRQA